MWRCTYYTRIVHLARWVSGNRESVVGRSGSGPLRECGTLGGEYLNCLVAHDAIREQARVRE